MTDPMRWPSAVDAAFEAYALRLSALLLQPMLDRVTLLLQSQGIAPMPKTKTRIYAVTDAAGAVTLVRATSAATAIHYVTRPRFTATVASQDLLVAALTNGLRVEDATAAPSPEAQPE